MNSTDNNDINNSIDSVDNSAKKIESTPGGKIGSFFMSAFLILILIILNFLFGSMVLYGCKIAQCNVFPTDVHCGPYTDNEAKINPIWTNIFTMSGLSMKLSIPYNENKKNVIIDLLRKSKYNPNSSNASNFFISIMEGLMSFNYSWVDSLFLLLNNLPETLILLLGPIIVTIVGSLMLIIEFFYLAYLWFSNLSWFFKVNKTSGQNVKPKWEPITFIEPVDFFWACVTAFIFFILYFLLLICPPFVLSLLPFLTKCFVFGSILGYTGIMNSKKVTFTDIFKDVLKYYKTTFMVTFALFCSLSAFSSLGTIPGVFCLVTVVLLAVFGSFFKSVPEQGLSAFVSSDQAIRQCIMKKKYGWFETFLQDLGVPLGNEQTTTQKIKTAGKIIQNLNSTRVTKPVAAPTSSTAPAPAPQQK